MQFPLLMKFKILALAPQIHVQDANGQDVCFVRQKLLKFKEQVEVFQTPKREHKIMDIAADRVIDFSARYRFVNEQGQLVGSMKRKGMKSLWRSHYDVFLGAEENMPSFTLTERNPMAKVMDAIFGEIPVVGLLSGYFFHPIYDFHRGGAEGSVSMSVTKKRSFLEALFTIENQDATNEEQTLLLTATMMMALLERAKG